MTALAVSLNALAACGCVRAIPRAESSAGIIFWLALAAINLTCVVLGVAV